MLKLVRIPDLLKLVRILDLLNLLSDICYDFVILAIKSVLVSVFTVGKISNVVICVAITVRKRYVNVFAPTYCAPLKPPTRQQQLGALMGSSP